MRITKNTRPGMDQSDPSSGRGIDDRKVARERLDINAIFCRDRGWGAVGFVAARRAALGLLAVAPRVAAAAGAGQLRSWS